MKYNVQYFPFSPNIPWKIKSNIIVPKIDGSTFNKIIENRDINFVSFGGLIETLLSLSIVEQIHFLHPDKIFYYSGNDKFNDLISVNGLCKLKQIDKDIIKDYPVPIFLDKEKNIYFNCLNNYIDIFKYTGEYVYRSYHPIFKQILDNSCLSLNNIIKIRNLEDPKELNNSKKFSFDKPFVLICPDKTGWSIHNGPGLSWHAQNVKSLAAMLNSVGINAIIMTPNIDKYFGINSLILKPNLKYLVWLMKKAKAVLAEDIDILLSGLLLSNAKIIAPKTYKEFSITRNAKIIKADNKVCLSKSKLEVIEVFEEIKR